MFLRCIHHIKTRRNEDWEKLSRWGRNTYLRIASPAFFRMPWCILTFLVKEGSIRCFEWKGRWSESDWHRKYGFEANCWCPKNGSCVTYISRFIIITKQLSDIIIKQVGFCFLLAFMQQPTPFQHTKTQHSSRSLISYFSLVKSLKDNLWLVVSICTWLYYFSFSPNTKRNNWSYGCPFCQDIIILA